MDKEEVMTKKNVFLRPLYRDLKSTIKYMTFSEEYKLMRQYVRNRALILQALPEGSQKANDGLHKLKVQYAKLLANHRNKMRNNDGFKLKEMKKRLEDMFKLLSLWQRYVDIIYMPETEVNMLRALKVHGQASDA